MHLRYFALAILTATTTGCISSTFQAKVATLPEPSTEAANVIAASDAAQMAEVSSRGELIGTIHETGNAMTNQADLTAKAATTGAVSGGTHVFVTGAGEQTYEWTNPASSSTSCTDPSDSSTCTTTYTPETSGTSVEPYASYDVYRVAPTQWPQLSDELRPAPIRASKLAPTGADGEGVTIGYFAMPFPGAGNGTTNGVFPTAYNAQPTDLEGVWLSSSIERGAKLFAADLRFGGSTITGLARNLQMGGSTAYSSDVGGASLALRVGAHADLAYASLAAGVGVQGSLWGAITTSTPATTPIQNVFVQPTPTIADLALPLWASLTVKPSCDWGVQGLAAYDVRPFGGASTPSFGLGLIWQPASFCR